MSRGLPECSAVACPTPIEPYRQQCRTTSAKSPWRAYLDLDFRVTEKRRSNKVLDTLKKEYRRTSTVWATGVSSLLWWKVLEERKKFSMSTTLPLAGLVAFSHLQFSQIRGRQPYLIVRKILYVIAAVLWHLRIPAMSSRAE
jgi:hypothetical protein